MFLFRSPKILKSPVCLLAGLLLACGSGDPSAPEPDASTTSSTYSLDSSQVPESLRHLVPFAEQWGIGDDVERMQFIERSSPSEREALASVLESHHQEITRWLDSFGSAPMSDEAAAFMYMQLALEEMP
jgi:hypothetical protein